MSVYETKTVSELLKGNSYPGRGILIGAAPDGRAVIAYFIMGRSDNSRNRVFEMRADGLYTRAFDESKVADPSLIIYRAAGHYENRSVVTNGDQTTRSSPPWKTAARLRALWTPGSSSRTPPISPPASAAW